MERDMGRVTPAAYKKIAPAVRRDRTRIRRMGRIDTDLTVIFGAGDESGVVSRESGVRSRNLICEDIF